MPDKPWAWDVEADVEVTPPGDDDVMVAGSRDADKRDALLRVFAEVHVGDGDILGVYARKALELLKDAR